MRRDQTGAFQKGRHTEFGMSAEEDFNPEIGMVRMKVEIKAD